MGKIIEKGIEFRKFVEERLKEEEEEEAEEEEVEEEEEEEAEGLNCARIL